MAIDKTNNKTDRRRPEAAPGAIVDGLSFPQHDPSNDPTAVQKHQVTPENE